MWHEFVNTSRTRVDAGGKYAAVMFDCDGVLVDSESLIAEVLVEMANDLGGTLTLEQGIDMFRGLPVDRCVTRLTEYLGHDVSDNLAEQYYHRSEQVFRDRLVPVAGVEDVLRSLTVPTCVVSNSSRDRLAFILETAGLSHYFGTRRYAAEQLAKWKPEPDIYIFAAAQLGFDASHCVAVEDSAAGVEAAVRAGAAVIGFGPAGRTPELLRHGARWICRTMRHVQDLVDALTR